MHQQEVYVSPSKSSLLPTHEQEGSQAGSKDHSQTPYFAPESSAEREQPVQVINTSPLREPLPDISRPTINSELLKINIGEVNRIREKRAYEKQERAKKRAERRKQLAEEKKNEESAPSKYET